MRVRIASWIGLVALLLPLTAGASDSAKVTVASKPFSLTVTQTFRKIMRGNKMRGYFARVQSRFLRVADRLVPPITALFNGPARKKVRGLAPNRLSWPVVVCPRRGDCNLDGVRFPAIVPVGPLTKSGDDRTAYIVYVPFSTKPRAGDLRWLRQRLQAVIEAHAGTASSSALSWTPPAPAQETVSGSLALRLTLNLHVLSAELSWFNRERAALLRQVRDQVQRQLKASSDLSFTTYRSSLRYVGDSKQLPGIVSAVSWDSRYHLVVKVALKRGTPSQITSLKAAISQRLDRLSYVRTQR